MKIDRKIDAGVVASDGAKTTSSFSIATSSHMFNILSSGLYADKIKAVLREIGCNAVDAHIMAGKPGVAIEVKLPNQLDPMFYVKDFGPGLDEDEIRQLYTTYGWSAKQDSDDVTGAFGLGSKSPFAYTHSFTVQSSKNGRMWTMTAHQDEDGKPVITKVAETEATSEWPNGVLVTFAVEPSDFDEFERKAQEVFQWFSVRPVIHGSAITLEPPGYDFRWQNYGFSKSGRTVAVVMGNVRYPVDVGILRGKVKLSDAAAGLTERSLTIWLPIGSAMMTPSRESLEYTKKTVEALAAQLERAAETLYQAVASSLQEPASSDLAMHRRVHRLRQSLPSAVLTALDKAFEAAEPEIKSVAEATWLKYVNPALQLDPWVGEGSSPMTPALRGLDGKIQFEPNSHRMLLDTSWKPAGARVYAIVGARKSRRSSIKTTKREIVGGRYANTTEEAQKIHLNIERIPPLYVLDCSVGMAALKLHLESTTSMDSGAERILALVVTGTGREPLDKAQAYAAKMVAQTTAFAESNVLLVSEEHESEVTEIRASRKRYRTKTREEWLEQEVLEMSLVTATAGREVALSTTTLDEFEDGNEQRYYVLKYNTGEIKWSTPEYDLAVATYRLGGFISEGVLARLCRVAGIEAESVIALENKAQLKALKLESNGYKEFFTALADAFKSDEEKRKLLLARTAPPVPSLTGYQYGVDSTRLGLVAALTKLKRKDSLVWQRMSERYPHHPVVLAAIAYDGMLDKDGMPIDKWRAVREFFDNVSYTRASFGLTGATQEDIYEMFDEAHKALPHWQVLNLEKLGDMAQEDGEVISTLLDVVFLLGTNLTQAAGIPQLKKAA